MVNLSTADILFYIKAAGKVCRCVPSLKKYQSIDGSIDTIDLCGDLHGQVFNGRNQFYE